MAIMATWLVYSLDTQIWVCTSLIIVQRMHLPGQVDISSSMSLITHQLGPSGQASLSSSEHSFVQAANVYFVSDTVPGAGNTSVNKIIKNPSLHPTGSKINRYSCLMHSFQFLGGSDEVTDMRCRVLCQRTLPDSWLQSFLLSFPHIRGT